MDLWFNKRRTGRTTRMLEEAVRQAKAGRAVYVVMTRGMQQMYKRNPLYEKLGIRLEVLAGLNIEWSPVLRLRGAHPNVLLLVDHHVIEQEFGGILRAWTQFDKGTPADTDATPAPTPRPRPSVSLT